MLDDRVFEIDTNVNFTLYVRELVVRAVKLAYDFDCRVIARCQVSDTGNFGERIFPQPFEHEIERFEITLECVLLEVKSVMSRAMTVTCEPQGKTSTSLSDDTCTRAHAVERERQRRMIR